MQLFLKTTAILLLFVQYFHSASLQESTDPPRRTIDSTWYRDPAKNKAGGQNEVSGWTTEYGQGPGETNMESGTDYSSGIASGSMVYETEEVATVEDPANQTSENTTTNETTQQPDATVSATALPKDFNQMNETDADKEIQNSTMTATTMIPDTSTAHVNPQSSSTEFQSTTSAPQSNTKQQSTVEPDTGLSNDMGTTTTAAVTTTAAETTAPSSMSSTSTAFPSETKETMAATTTVAPSTSEKANISDKGSSQGSSSERGLASDSQSKRRNGAWGGVLGTAVGVACMGLVVYVVMKKKHHKAFSHRKLVEVFPSDPVLRLDNSEPLDLNFGGSAYYNPALQGDNIQMTSFPGCHKN
ncbi:mucin-15 [Sphaeramia orbicularis]|uniref:Mucin-15 n=1 Tax=Sphaeramia orbicularis TaxID=375764 RepID=A0A673CFN7_9TELE|nr:mucin-15 [Sphaeramia orbicularis]